MPAAFGWIFEGNLRNGLTFARVREPNVGSLFSVWLVFLENEAYISNAPLTHLNRTSNWGTERFRQNAMRNRFIHLVPRVLCLNKSRAVSCAAFVPTDNLRKVI